MRETHGGEREIETHKLRESHGRERERERETDPSKGGSEYVGEPPFAVPCTAVQAIFKNNMRVA